MKKSLIILTSLALLALTGCSENDRTQEELKGQAIKESQEKQIIEEKKFLSDFVNKAYSATALKDIPALVKEMNSKIKLVSQESAVKMILHMEMAQRIVLQNDMAFGEISQPLSDWLETQPKFAGIILPEQLQPESKKLQDELTLMASSYFGIQKLGNKFYLAIDFSKYSIHAQKLSAEYAQYQKIMAEETQSPAVLDQKIQLEPNVLMQRILLVDEFYRDNPVPSDGIMQNNMSDEYKMLIRLMLYGTAQNSNWTNEGVLLPEWQVTISTFAFPPNSELYIPFNTLKQQLLTTLWKKTPESEQSMQSIIRAVNNLVEVDGK